jgi:hypothetical protein
MAERSVADHLLEKLKSDHPGLYSRVIKVHEASPLTPAQIADVSKNSMRALNTITRDRAEQARLDVANTRSKTLDIGPGPKQTWGNNPLTYSVESLAQYQTAPKGDSPGYLLGITHDQEKAINGADYSKEKKAFLKGFFQMSGGEQGWATSNWRNTFAKALESGTQFTAEQQTAFDRYILADKALTESAGREWKKPTSFLETQEFKNLAGKRIAFNEHVTAMADRKFGPSPRLNGYPIHDRIPGKKEFIDKYFLSVEHGLVKSETTGLWTHHWDNPKNLSLLNRDINVGRRAETSLGGVLQNINALESSAGHTVNAGEAGRMAAFLQEFEPEGIKAPDSLREAIEKINGMDITPSLDIVPEGVIGSTIIQSGGQFPNMSLMDADLYNSNRTITAPLLAGSTNTNTDALIRDPSRVNGGYDYVHGNPHGSGVAPGELQNYRVGNNRGLVTTTEEMINDLTKLGRPITTKTLIAAMLERAGPGLIREIESRGLQRGASDPILLAALAGGMGLTLGIAKAIPDEEKAAFIEASMEVGSKLGDAYGRMVDAGDEALDKLPGVKSGRSLWEWYRDKTEAGSTYRGADQSLSSLIPGVNTHINNVLAFLGGEVSEAAGAFAKAAEVKDLSANADVVPEFADIYTGPGTGDGQWMPDGTWRRANHFQEQIDQENRGLLQDNWT